MTIPAELSGPWVFVIVLWPIVLVVPAVLGVAITALLSWLMECGKRGTEKRMVTLGLLSTGMAYILGYVSFRVMENTDWIEALLPVEDPPLIAWYCGCVGFGVFMMLCGAAWCWFRPQYPTRQTPPDENTSN